MKQKVRSSSLYLPVALMITFILVYAKWLNKAWRCFWSNCYQLWMHALFSFTKGGIIFFLTQVWFVLKNLFLQYIKFFFFFNFVFCVLMSVTVRRDCKALSVEITWNIDVSFLKHHIVLLTTFCLRPLSVFIIVLYCGLPPSTWETGEKPKMMVVHTLSWRGSGVKSG